MSSTSALLQAAALALTAIALPPAASAAEGSLFPHEPPALARLLDDGLVAEAVGNVAGAEARYCAAARLGSVEGQYRLGAFYRAYRLSGRTRAMADALLANAAQQGHLEAQRALGKQAVTRFPTPPCFATPLDLAEVARIGRVITPVEVKRYVAALPSDRQVHARLVQRLAPRFGVDPRLALAIVRNESAFDPQALSPKNAMGLMQLIPETAARFRVADAFDPEQNVRGGLAYLRWLLDEFDGDVARTAAAYNAGEGTVRRYDGVPPYEETRTYVARVLSFYRAHRHVKPGAG